MIHPEDQALVWGRFQDRLAGKTAPPRYEYRGIRKDRTVRWLEMHASQIEYGGKPAILGAIIDITDRKRAEEALRISEEQHRIFAELTSDYVYVFRIDPNGQPVLEWISGAFDRMTGYTAGELRAQPNPFGNIHPDDLLVVAENHRRVMEGETTVIETRIVTKHGEVRWVRNYARPIWDNSHSRVVAIYGAAQDITEHKRAEERIRVANERLEYLMSSSSVAIYSAETHVKYAATFISGNIAELTGYESREFVENPDFWYDRVHLDDRQIIATEVPKLFEKNIHAYEYRFRCKDGNYIWIHDEMKLVRDEKGNPAEIIGVWSDITERKRAAEELRKASAEWQTTFDSTGELVILLDTEFKIVRANLATSQFLQLDMNEILGKTCHRLVHGTESPPDTCPLTRMKQTKKRECAEMYLPERDMWISVSADPILDDQGNFSRVVHTINDITERKRAAEELDKAMAELERSNAELERFAYVASHDLQEPLRMVSSYVQLLERRYKDKLDADANDFIDYAMGGAKRMEELLNDLLVYSRVGTRAKPFRRTDMEAVLEAALANLQVTIKDSKARVSHDPLPTVMADEVQLVQVFQNLIGNAIKFRGEKSPRIHVSAEQRDSEWVFSVKDNGIGIEPQHFDRVFLIFQRLHREEYPGTGTGLAIAQKIIERHGGRMWIESQPGKGSTFYFSIQATGKRQQAVGNSKL